MRVAGYLLGSLGRYDDHCDRRLLGSDVGRYPRPQQLAANNRHQYGSVHSSGFSSYETGRGNACAIAIPSYPVLGAVPWLRLPSQSRHSGNRAAPTSFNRRAAPALALKAGRLPPSRPGTPDRSSPLTVRGDFCESPDTNSGDAWLGSAADLGDLARSAGVSSPAPRDAKHKIASRFTMFGRAA